MNLLMKGAVKDSDTEYAHRGHFKSIRIDYYILGKKPYSNWCHIYPDPTSPQGQDLGRYDTSPCKWPKLLEKLMDKKYGKDLAM